MSDSPESNESMMRKLQTLRALLEKIPESETAPKSSSPETLQQMYTRLTERHSFVPGDLVRWKPGLKDRKRPMEGEPAIVVKRLEQPVFDTETNAGSPYFNVPYDLVLGLFDGDGDFITYHFCSDRFEPYA